MTMETSPYARESHVSDRSASSGLLSAVELAAGLLVLFLLVVLHVMVFLHAGPLWRDEISSLNVAREPSLLEMFKAGQYDSFPSLWHLLLRAWISLGLGGTDLMLRLFGMLTGLGIVAALCWTARSLGVRVPLISLSLFALSPSVLLYGDGLRAYGFGVLMMVLTVGAVWRMVQNPTPGRIGTAAVIAVLGVHAVYANSVMLLAVFVAVVVLGFSSRKWKPGILLLVIGLIAAASMLCYFYTFSRISQWNCIVRLDISNLGLLRRFAAVGTSFGWTGLGLWTVLVMTAAAGCVYRLTRPGSDLPDRRRPLSIFLLSLMIAGSLSYLVYLRFLSVWTQAWYFFPILGLLVVLCDGAVWLIVQTSPLGRILRIALALLLVVITAPNAWKEARTRATDLDLVAHALETQTGKDDLIIVDPFYMGTSFARYFHGPTPWMTVPPLDSDFRYQPYRLVKDKMAEMDPMQPVVNRIAETLRSGHRVWFVGSPEFLKPDEVPAYPPPAPNRPLGWSWTAYSSAWSHQATFKAQILARSIQPLRVTSKDPVRSFENVRTYFVAVP